MSTDELVEMLQIGKADHGGDGRDRLGSVGQQVDSSI